MTVLPLHPASVDPVAAARAGAPEALAALFAAHGAAMHRVAWRLTCSAEDARDIVQDVFVMLPEALAGYEGRGSLAGWLHRLTVRAALMRMRAARRRREVAWDEEASAQPPRDASPEAVLDRMAIEQALAALPAQLRTVFVLREIEGYSHAEIAALLGLRRGTSEVHLFRARQRLRALLRGSR